MIPHQCKCGQRIDVGVEPRINGFDYAAEFSVINADGSATIIARCPRCRVGLYDALKTGALTDISVGALKQLTQTETAA